MRDAGRHSEAAGLYEAALALAPGKVGVHVQAGHMFKEASDFGAAARHYAEAERLAPGDADLQLQLGHFNKRVDRLAQARAHYARAVKLAPGWPEPQRELAELTKREAALDLSDEWTGDVPVPELLPGPIEPQSTGPLDAIRLRRLGGRRARTAKGMVPLLSGVEAIHGTCFCDRPLVEATVMIDEQVIAREPMEMVPTADPAVMKAVFNLWVDLSAIPAGLHRLDLVLADADGWTRRHVERIAVAAPVPAGDTAPFDSDGRVTLSPGNGCSVEQQVRALPSVVRSVHRVLMPAPAAILVLRTDQLGDMVVSVPALQRLRALFPAAQIVGLVTGANADLARSLGLFDEVLVADFPDDPDRRRRIMTADAQKALAARLAAYRFDVAIDLATSDVSRPLLQLTGARLTFGFDHGNSPWLDGGISGSVRDPRGDGDAAPQSGRVLALVERLGTLCATGAHIVRRSELGRDHLATLGLGPDEPFVVLHTGARVVFSRWPGFPELARAWLDRHPGKVVLLAEGTDVAGTLPAELHAENRLIVIDRRLAFDQLDALLSFAQLFVGNDSGPKHLAALRGTPVVSIHCARIGWAEWSQEQTGVVISRRVPCAGCALFHDADECGKGIACVTDIGWAEVLAAAEAAIA
ncbi:glycosyltransferase family 9 protein [Sphingomonas gellani]|nr:glycosyltransferase family 9 protein [Sphingomonas gellani]